MKTLTIILFTLLLSQFSFSQDTLFFKNGHKETVRILELKRDMVKYSSLDTTDLKTYYVSNVKVDSAYHLKEGTGYYYIFAEIDPEHNPMVLPEKEIIYPNRFGIDAYDAFFSLATMYYQHTFKKFNYLTIGIPLSFSPRTLFSDNYKTDPNFQYNQWFYYNKYKNYSTGLELTFYPNKFIYGVAFDFGSVKFRTTEYFYDSSTGISYDIVKFHNAPFYGMFVRIGYDILINHFGISAYANLGVQRSTYIDSYYYPQNNDQITKYESTSLSSRVNVRIHYSF